MKRIYFLCAITLLILTTISCKKEELPEATQIGANTLGCKINGVPFKCTRKLTTQGIPIPGIEIGISKNNILRIKASTYSKRDAVAFYVKYDRGIGKYTSIKNVVEGTNSYVEITRFSGGIISGYFEITLREIKVATWEGETPLTYDTLITRYTEGRFDVRL